MSLANDLGQPRPLPIAPRVARRRRRVLPGFGLTLGYTITYLSLIILIPLAALVAKGFSQSWGEFWNVVTSPRVVASYKLTFGASAIAAGINAVFGFIVAWTLVRYRSILTRLIEPLVDLPFALPTAVSGIALTAIYAPKGWVGSWFNEWGIKLAYTPIGVTIALTFIGLPFVVRTLQPALEDLDAEVEEAAAVLGANRWQTFLRIIVPTILPSLLTGFALAFARAVGEYGSVVFISGNKPMRTEITPHLIIAKLEEYEYAGAAAIGTVMLAVSFVLLLTINLLQYWASRHQRRDA